jgi:hypothetical protein
MGADSRIRRDATSDVPLVPGAAFVQAHLHLCGINCVVNANHENVVLQVSMLLTWDHNPVTGTRNKVSIDTGTAVQVRDNRLVNKDDLGHVATPLKWPCPVSGVASSVFC